jgi:hypothetical protein
MDEFGYLSVLLSIIIGLAVTQLLTGLRGLMLQRARIRVYWVPVAWGLVFLMILTQTWWAMFGLRGHREWTFAEFAAVLFHTIVMYLTAAIILPDVGDEPVDLRAHYYRHRGWLFSLLLLATAASLVKSIVLSGSLPDRRDVAFHMVYAGVGVLGLATARPRVHEVLAAGMGILFGLYIALLFTRLG